MSLQTENHEALEALQIQLTSKLALISRLEGDIQRLNDLQARSAQSPVIFLLLIVRNTSKH
jgi:hypothetical protein